MKNSLGIYGAGGFGREIIPMIKDGCKVIDSQGMKVKIKETFFIETVPSAPQINNYQVFSEDQLGEIRNKKIYFTIAIADSRARQKIAERMHTKSFEAAALIDSSAILHTTSTLGEGAILSHLAIVTANTKIGKHFHGNYRSYVAHDCTIGDYVTFAPGASCNGNVDIADHVYVGSNATIKQGSTRNPLRIGKNSIIGMGAVVTKSVPDYAVVVGNPARVIRYIDPSLELQVEENRENQTRDSN